MYIHPDDSGNYAVVQFTVPTTGSYTLTGAFEGLDFVGPTTTEDHVWRNSGAVSTSLFDTQITAYYTNSSNSCPGSSTKACGYSPFSITQSLIAAM